MGDAAPAYAGVLEDSVLSAWHHVERHANNPIETNHSQLKLRLRPMRGLRTDRSAQTIVTGHAFVQTFDVDSTVHNINQRDRDLPIHRTQARRSDL